MYKNVVSTRELLSNSFSSERQDSRDLSYDTQHYSQLAYSQPEFSQINSQDMFTQQFSSGSQNESINTIPNRRPTLYDKWKSKTTTPFRSVPAVKTPVCSSASRTLPTQHKSDISLQHQLQINKAKAKERDERDFLQQVVNTVQDCTREVKLTLTSVREKLDQNGERSEQNLQHTINSFLDDLCKHQERILSAVQEKDANSMQYHDLEKELALKEAKIRSLEKTVEDYKRETPEKIICALQKQLRSPQQKVDDKLTELLETTRDNHEQYAQQIQEQRQQLEQQQRLYSELKKAQQTQIKDSEKRLINEVSNLRKDIKKKENSCLQDILDQLKTTQEQQFEEFERHISRLLEGSNNTTSDCNVRDQRQQKKEMQVLLKKQWDGVGQIIEAQFQKHMRLQEQQLVEAVDKMTERESRDCQGDSFLSLPQFEDKMGQYHDDFKKQVESLHERHVQELKSLRSEMASKQDEQPDASETQPSSRVAKVTGERSTWDQRSGKEPERVLACPEYKFSDSGGRDKSESRKSWRHELAIVSPLTANYKKLNTKSFFSKTAFSPIGTILPRRQEAQLAQVSKLEQENKPLILQEMAITEVTTVCKKKTKKRRRRVYSKPKKSKPSSEKSQTKEPVVLPHVHPEKPPAKQSSQKSTETVNQWSKAIVPAVSRPQTMIPSGIKTKTGMPTNYVSKAKSDKIMSVYDFRDEEVQKKVTSKHIPFYGSRTQSYSYNSRKNELMTVNTSQTVTFPQPSKSPSVDTISRDSSPSLSITEVVVKRRIKCDKRTPDILHFNPGGFQKLDPKSQFPVYDILSTPTINAVGSSEQKKSFWSYKQNMHQSVRRGEEKRKLCNIDAKENILQCLHNQAKRICH